MPSHVSTRVQLHHYLLLNEQGSLIKFAEIKHYEIETEILNEVSPMEQHQIAEDSFLSFLSFEVIFVGLILLSLPLIIYFSYRFGKKRGQKEHNNEKTEEDSGTKKKGRSNPSDYMRQPATQIREEESKALVPYVGIQSPLRIQSRSIHDESDKTGECQEESTAESESKSPPEMMKLKQHIESQTTGRGLSAIERDVSNMEGYDNSIMNLKSDSKVDLPKFEVNLARFYSVEEKSEDLVTALNEEKLKLHTEDEQVSKVEIKYHLSFENKDGNLHKIERQEIKTVYTKDCKVAENNAVMLKNAYENYQNDPTSQSQCVFLNRSSECKNQSPTQSSALIPFNNANQQIIPANNTENQICLIPPIEKKVEKYFEKNEIKEIGHTKTNDSEVKMPSFQIDDIPHETGKFGKIFKNVEIIGEGAFGKVYKVVHKLDGKIYAVKKAKLKLDSFEDLQQKSKVFREVFAMTDLHHPNIVRYSTCWVEIEDKQNKKAQRKPKSQLKSIQSQSVGTEESESRVSESEKSHTNTSSVGFEWDLGDAENSESKTKENAEKKHLEIVAQRMESSIMKSLMSFNDEQSLEDSSPTHLSQTGYSEYFGGHNLYLYIQMEFCAGQNLRDYLDEPKRDYSERKTLAMFRKILEGVFAIHQKGIFHRDLKPANIFLDENENIKIGDFGLASLGNNEESKEAYGVKQVDLSSDKSYSKHIGTPMYASPEQAGGGRYNYKTDIYSLGFILAEMMAGLSTHHERYQLFKLLREAHELPCNFKNKFNRESELILKMTSFHPDERPTAEELIAEIDKLLGNENPMGKVQACR